MGLRGSLLNLVIWGWLRGAGFGCVTFCVGLICVDWFGYGCVSGLGCCGDCVLCFWI